MQPRRVPAVALCALLAACGQHEPGESARPPGTAERVVHYYNWANYIGPDTIPAFEAATGIKVIYDAYDAEETLETVLLMGGTGYDVVGASMGTFATGIAAGAFMPLDRAQLPNWDHLDPHALAVLGQFDPGNRYAVPFLHSINGFAYNLDMVRARMPDAPVDSLDMLFKPDVVARFADCGVSFLDSPADVIQLALKYLHLDPNSDRPRTTGPWKRSCSRCVRASACSIRTPTSTTSRIVSCASPCRGRATIPSRWRGHEP